MTTTIHTFEDVYLHVANLLINRPKDTTIFRIEKNLFADIDIDSSQHIQVNLYESLDEEPTDGGGICMLWNDDQDEGYDRPEDDPEYIDNIRTSGTPQQLAQCIQDKALFVWSLIHSA